MAPPKTDDYRRALDAAIREYEELGRKRAEIDLRLSQLAQSIGVLTRLCGFIPTVSLGLTDGCRLVLRGAGVPLTPIEVRDKLTAIGFDWSKYSNELASIHTVLKRLNQSGEIRLVARASGKDAYVGDDRPATVVIGAKHAYLWQHPPRSVPLTKTEIDALLEERSRRRDTSARIESSGTNQPETNQAAEPAPAVQEEASRPKTPAAETPAAGGRLPAGEKRRRSPVPKEKKTK